MAAHSRKGLFAGVALLSLGAVVLQIVFTRVYSALFGYHYAFLAVSLGLFGAGLGGMLAYAFPSLVPLERFYGRAALLSGLAAAATVVALLTVLNVPHPDKLDATVVTQIGIVYAISAVPFTLAAIPVAAAVRYAKGEIGGLYFVDLFGAALAGVAAMLALRIGGLRACLAVAVELSTAALLFYVLARRAGEGQRRGNVIAGIALCSAVLLAGDYGATPWLKLPKLRWATADKVDFESWSDLGLVTVDKNAGTTAWMRVDASSTMAIFEAKSDPPIHPDEMSYVLHKDKGPTVVIGAGGGRDVRAALKYAQKDIRAVEINPVIVEDVMLGKMRTFSGDLYSRPEVHVVIADGRSYVRESTEPLRNIVLSLVDTSAASSFGALALVENSLYTVEGFEDDLAHLMPEGTLVVNRWDGELNRLLATATEALRRRGSERPADHLYACSASRSTALLVKKTKLLAPEIKALRQSCETNHFVEVFAPDDAHGIEHERLTSMRASEAVPDSATDLSPATDDRPFFFYSLPPRRFLAQLGTPAVLATSHPAVLLLIGLLAASATVAAIAFLFPILATPERVLRSRDPGARMRSLSFFAAIGAGFSLVELALVQELTMFLGHPSYALSAVLVALLLWAGVGSALSVRVSEIDAGGSAARRAQVLALLLAVFAVALGPVLARAVGLPFGVRLGVTLALIAPLGILMGAETPLGVKAIAARAPDLVPWCWGLGGLAAVVACGLAPLLALNFGFAAVFLAGGLCYLAAAILSPASSPAPQI
jgi:hypothetical protein